MAQIDKVLPNVTQDVKLPSQQKIAQEQQVQMADQMKQPTELQPNEDGVSTLILVLKTYKWDRSKVIFRI